MAGAVCNFSSYEPSSLVTAFHGIPHSDINLNSSPDTFELSSEYFEVSIIQWRIYLRQAVSREKEGVCFVVQLETLGHTA